MTALISYFKIFPHHYGNECLILAWFTGLGKFFGGTRENDNSLFASPTSSSTNTKGSTVIGPWWRTNSTGARWFYSTWLFSPQSKWLEFPLHFRQCLAETNIQYNLIQFNSIPFNSYHFHLIKFISYHFHLIKFISFQLISINLNSAQFKFN